MSRLGTTLQTCRRRRGWSQAELSRQAGVQNSTISALEAGRQQSIRADRLERIATALRVSVGALLNGDTAETLAEDPPSVPVPAPPEAVVLEAVRRSGKYLDPSDWARVAGYLDAIAEERRRNKG